MPMVTMERLMQRARLPRQLVLGTQRTVHERLRATAVPSARKARPVPLFGNGPPGDGCLLTLLWSE